MTHHGSKLKLYFENRYVHRFFQTLCSYHGLIPQRSTATTWLQDVAFVLSAGYIIATGLRLCLIRVHVNGQGSILLGESMNMCKS
jgi:hypothetical protein